MCANCVPWLFCARSLIVDCFSGAVQKAQLKHIHHLFEVIRALPDNAWLQLISPALQAYARTVQ